MHRTADEVFLEELGDDVRDVGHVHLRGRVRRLSEAESEGLVGGE